MPSQKISQLPIVLTITPNDLYPLVQSGTNFAIKFSSIQTAILSALTSGQLPTITLTGDVTGAASGGSIPIVVQSVGGATASNIATSVSAYLASTPSNTPNTLVKRDTSGNFSAGTITANLIGAASANVLKSGDTMSGDLDMGGNNINNVTNVFGEQRLFTTNVVKVKKNPGYGEFSSIAAAIASITTASASNPFFVQVGPGIYTEPQLVMKPYVYVGGLDFESTIIQPSNPAAHLIVASDNSAIFNVLLTGVTGSGQALVYYASTTNTVTTSFWVENVKFGSSDTLAIADGTNGYSNLFVNSCKFGGPYQFNKGFIAKTTGTTYGKITIKNSTSTQMTAPYPVDMFVCDGVSCEIGLKSVIAKTGVTGGGGNGVRIRNGGTLRAISLDIEGFSKGLWVENVGANPTIIGQTIVFVDNIQDIQIDHPGTTGALTASANDDTKVFINSAATQLGYSIIGLEDGDTVISGKLKQTQPDGTFTDLSTLASSSGPTGLLSNGDIEPPISGTTVTVKAGIGYLQKSDGSLRKITWPDTPLSVPNNSENWLYFDSTGTLQQSGIMPDAIQNIILGKVVTGVGKILLIEESGFLANKISNKIGTALRNGLGAVFSNGSIVSETDTRKLNIAPGQYYYGEREFLSQGANPTTFTAFYRDGLGGFIDVPLQTTIDNANYDDGTGTLAPITTGFYAKHSLYMVGDSTQDFDSEAYFLVYAQARYNSLVLAEQAALPNPPNFLSGSVVLIASIIVTPDNANIVEIRDERPIISSKRISTVAATSFHHNLLGLNDFDDHLRYLPVDGSRPMTNDLPMGTHNIVNAGTYNNVVVENHHARHQPGSGLDELPTGAAVTQTPDQANAVGISTSLSRADHIHNIPTATAVGLSASSVNTQGVASTFSRSDHTHAISSGIPVTQTPNQSNATGTSANFARADHIHNIPTGIPSTLNATNTNTQGTAAAFAQQDHLHAISTGAATTQIPNQTNATGSSANLARADHIHNIPTGIASTISSNSNTDGSASAFARQDHSHQLTANIALLDQIPQYDGSNWQAVYPETSSPARAYRIFEEWLAPAASGDKGWTTSLVGGGSIADTIGVDSGHPGVLQLRAGNAAVRSASVNLGPTVMFIGGGIINIEMLVNLQTLTNAVFRFGLGDQNSADHNNGIYFEYNSGVSANWLIKTANGGTRTTTTTTSVATSATWNKLIISINAAGTNASFTINGVSVGNISTNLPTSAIAPNLQAISLGTTFSPVWIDYFNMYQRFTVSR